MTGLVLLMFIAGTARVDAATVQVTLTVLGSRDIDVAVAGPPFDEFHAQRSSWGSVTINGALIGYYVLSTEDKMHVGNQGSYPGIWVTIVIRTIGSPSEIIVLRGVGESTSIRGGIEVATGSLAFLRGAQFGLAQNVLSLTY
jgi:hypothetical protein